MQEKRLWKLFFYLSLIASFVSILNIYFLLEVVAALTHHQQFISIAIRFLWGVLLAFALLIGAYYQFKPVLFYNLYLFLYGLKCALDSIASYKSQHAADFGAIVLHYSFSLNDFLNIFSIVTNTIACIPGLILLGIYTIRWIKQVKLRRRVNHSDA